MRLLALVALALLVPMAAPSAVACAPPCGYIIPLLDIEMDEPVKCRAGLGQEIVLEDCLVIPPQGESVTMTGMVIMEWEVSEDGTYPNEANEDIVLTFAGAKSNPTFLDFSVEPSEFTVTTADLLDPANMEQREREGSQVGAVWWAMRFPISVTITTIGEPNEEDIETIVQYDGRAEYHLKVRSTESGTRYKASYAVERFDFDGSSVLPAAEVENLGTGDGGKDSPGPLAGVMVLGLLGLVAARRRRDQ